jgi:P-type Ca2+ transporter type 2C
VVASTMLLTTLSFFHIFAGLLARDQVNTIFDREAVPGSIQLRRYGLALVLTIAVTGIGFLQRLIGTKSLDLAQWGVCLGIALTLVIAEEILKIFLRRRAQPNLAIPTEPELVSA